MEPFPDVRTLIPHSGPSCLLDAVLGVGPRGVECRASIPPDHPYRSGSSVHPLLAIELFAQAAAVHQSLAGEQGASAAVAGQLVAAEIEVQKARLDLASELLVRVVPGATFGAMTKFAGELYCSGHEPVLVAHGEVSVALGAAI